MSASTELADVGATFVSAKVNWSAPRSCTFSATASTNELNLLKTAIVYDYGVKLHQFFDLKCARVAAIFLAMPCSFAL